MGTVYIFHMFFPMHVRNLVAKFRSKQLPMKYYFLPEFTFLGQWWAGSNCTIHCENPDDIHMIGKEHSIVLMNHKYDIDWLMGWILSERMAMLGVSHCRSP